MSDAEQLLPPDEAYDVAVGIFEDWLGYAEQAIGDGTAVEYPISVLANATGRMASLLMGKLAAHRPVYKHGAWVCGSSCVELQQVGFAHAAAPCAEARSVFEMLNLHLVEAAPGGLQMIVQDGAEPYVTFVAGELERMHGLTPATARSHASSAVRVISGVCRRARH